MVYKVKIIQNSKIKETYIFGDDNSKEDFSSDVKNGEINTKKYIHNDDTVFNIKNKIIQELGYNVSYEEIYLFSKTSISYNLEKIFDILSQNNSIEIVKNRLISFLLNLNKHKTLVEQLKKDEEDKEYSFDDLLKLNLDNALNVKIPIGLNYNVKNKYPFVVNPYDVFEIDELLKNSAENIVDTQNLNLLLDYNLNEQEIYVCLAEDVIKYSEKNKLNVESMIKIYFPFLFDKNVTSNDELLLQREELIQNTRSYFTKYYEKSNNDTNMMYLIYNERNIELPYETRGIKSMNFVIHPISSTFVPIDLFIKSLETTENMPLIKLNRGKRGEKIFRLFTNNITKYGKKIPLLKRLKIKKINKILARKKSVGFLLEESNVEFFIVEFFENGNIEVNIKFNSVKNEEDFEKIIEENLNELLLNFNKTFENSGYQYNLFKKFDENIEFINIEIENKLFINKEVDNKLNINKKINIKKYLSCISNIFTIEEYKLSSKGLLNYKKVSNFEKLNSIDNFIVIELKRDEDVDVITDKLVDNFNITREEAKMSIVGLLENLRLQQNMHENKKLKIVLTPGFKINLEFKTEKLESTLKIQVENIDNIKYVKHIQIYLDSLIRLTQNKKSTNYSSKKIDNNCKKIEQYKEDEIKEDIISTSNKGINNFQEVNIEENRVEYESNEEDNALEFLEELGILNEEEEGDMEIEELELEELELGDVILENIDEQEQIEEQTDEIQEQIEPKEPMEQIEEQTDEEEEILEKDIVNMKLSYPNPFEEKLRSKDPKLFLKKDSENFKSYSRICPWNLRRQPVVLTDKEKKKIDSDPNSKGSYSNAAYYGSSEDKRHWYICPRYWCLKTNKPLTHEDISNNNACGGKDAIIPHNAKKVPPGKYIFEFFSKNNNEHIDPSDGGYAKHGISFLKEKTHPDNLCIPCCFKYKLDKDHNLTLGDVNDKRYEQCHIETKKSKKKESRQTEDDKVAIGDYIKDPVRFPLKQNNYGFIPGSLEKFFNQVNNTCIISDLKQYLKKGASCLLRQGVEQNNNQSFISCISLFYTYLRKKQKATPEQIYTIENFKSKVLLKSINIDVFVQLQNGNLVDIFYNESINIDSKSEELVKLKIYKTELFKSVNKNEIGIKYYNKVIRSYLNFREFIKNKNTYIDYSYLWDFVSNYLYTSKINVVIFRIPDNDLTDNIEIICPTNHYSENIFDPKRKTIFILQKDKFFEPIMNFTSKGDDFVEIKNAAFSFNDKKTNDNIKTSLAYIEKYLLNCSAENNYNYTQTYTFENNISASKIVDILEKNDITVEKQILNLNNKIIGLQILYDKGRMFIPTRPTNILSDIDILLIDDFSIYSSYETTKNNLKKITEDFEFPFKPKFKVKEDGLIVGIITNTNQLVPINPPQEDVNDELEVIEELNSINVDKNTILNNEKDKQRITTVKRIQLENNFFSAFRNTVKMLLSKRSNIKLRKEIEENIKINGLYLKKYNIIIKLLKELLKNYIAFKEYDESTIKNLEKIIPCISNENSDCNTKYCLFDNNHCKLILPKLHLFTKNNNEEIYYGRLADELLRYNNIQNYLLGSNKHLIIQKIDYNLNDNEIIILEDIIDDYFKNLVPFQDSNYAKFNSFENVEPIEGLTNKVNITIKPKEEKPKEEKLKEEKLKEDLDDLLCNQNNFNKLVTTERKIYIDNYGLPKTTIKTKFNQTGECSFLLFSIILSDYLKKKVTVQEIKNTLIKFYNEKYTTSVLKTLIEKKGKKSWNSNQMTISKFINSDEYYIGPIDIDCLSYIYKLSLIVFSQSKDVDKTIQAYNNNSELADKFYIIKRSSIKKDVPFNLELFKSNDNEFKFNSFDFTEQFKQLITENMFNFTKLEKYFKSS